jgi:hypothetical protein
MGDALRRLFLSIGIALGLASPQPDPAIAARLGLDSGLLVASARIENAFAPGARELIAAGTKVALRFSASVELPSRPLASEETRALWYDLRSGFFDVSYDEGKTAALVDPSAAMTLASELSGLALCEAREAPLGTRIVIRAQIGILDSSGLWHDAPVLWNYVTPRAVLSYSEGTR